MNQQKVIFSCIRVINGSIPTAQQTQMVFSVVAFEDCDVSSAVTLQISLDEVRNTPRFSLHFSVNMWCAHVHDADCNIPLYMFFFFYWYSIEWLRVVIQWQRGLFQEIFLTQKSFWILQGTFGVDKRYFLVFLPAKKFDSKHRVFQANVTVTG